MSRLLKNFCKLSNNIFKVKTFNILELRKVYDVKNVSYFSVENPYNIKFIYFLVWSIKILLLKYTKFIKLLPEKIQNCYCYKKKCCILTMASNFE